MAYLSGTDVVTGLGMGLGVAAALLAGVLARAVLSLPPDNRQFLDPPPWAFRLLWWPIRLVAAALQPWWPRRWQRHAGQQLQLAGLTHHLLPLQWEASRWVCGGLVAAVWFWMASTFADAGGSVQPGLVAVGGGWVGYLYPRVWLRDRLQQRRRSVVRTLPFFLDTITLCVEAGLNFQGALQQAVAYGPAGPLRDECQRVLRDIRAGKSRADSLDAMAVRLNEPGVTHLCHAVLQAERLGMALGPVLRAQADQRRHERFLRAEKLAMQAPVKMLLPLIAFIFPSTFIVLFFPIAMRFIQSGL